MFSQLGIGFSHFGNYAPSFNVMAATKRNFILDALTSAYFGDYECYLVALAAIH
jgi:hypothetical protein